MSTKKSGSPGRPRDEAIRIRILRTAVAILIKRGYRQATMNEIALRAGVGKQTLYRWWKNRAGLLMEALLYFAEENVDAAVEGYTGPALERFLKRTFSSISNETGVILKTLAAESIADKKFARVFFNAFIAKRQQVLAQTIRQELSIPEGRQDTIDTLVDIIFGAMWYRTIFGHRPLDETLATELSDIVDRIGSQRVMRNR
jgi:AcrR family transcriptional regulator